MSFRSQLEAMPMKLEPRIQEALISVIEENPGEEGRKVDCESDNTTRVVHEFLSPSSKKFVLPPESEKVREAVRKAIEGSMLIDLGCGQYPRNIIALARDLGAGHYIGIDKALPSSEVRLDEKDGRSMPVVMVRAGMLSTLSRLPAHSSNFAMTNIDTFIIESKNLMQRIVEAIADACKIGGVVIGANATSLTSLYSKYGFSHLDIHGIDQGVIGTSGRIDIYQKPPKEREWPPVSLIRQKAREAGYTDAEIEEGLRDMFGEPQE